MKDNYTFSSIYNNAHANGMAAVKAMTPTPMVVGSPTTMFGNDIDYSKKTYFVADGVCGFAWVSIHPASAAGRKDCEFVKWLRANSIGRYGDYEHAWVIWVSDFGQSYERKMAYASAFADALTEAGIKAYSNGRLD